jgi:DNA-binding CsgD family transcriptional regulator
MQVLAGVVDGKSVADIAASVYLSPSTVRNHLATIYRKFGVHSRSELLAALLRSS